MANKRIEYTNDGRKITHYSPRHGDGYGSFNAFNTGIGVLVFGGAVAFAGLLYILLTTWSGGL